MIKKELYSIIELLDQLHHAAKNYPNAVKHLNSSEKEFLRNLTSAVTIYRSSKL